MSDKLELVWYDNLTRPKAERANASKEMSHSDGPVLIWYDDPTKNETEECFAREDKQQPETPKPAAGKSEAKQASLEAVQG